MDTPFGNKKDLSGHYLRMILVCNQVIVALQAKLKEFPELHSEINETIHAERREVRRYRRKIAELKDK